MKYQEMVYVSHPYGGDVQNKEIVENIIKRLVKEYPNYLFISPIHSFAFLYEDTDYQQGLDMCLWLLDKCDEVWVLGDYQNSIGCMSEIAYCQNHLIPYRIIETDCPWQYIHFDAKEDTVYKQLKQIKNKCEICNECGLVDYDEYHIVCKQHHVDKLYKTEKRKVVGE